MLMVCVLGTLFCQVRQVNGSSLLLSTKINKLFVFLCYSVTHTSQLIKKKQIRKIYLKPA